MKTDFKWKVIVFGKRLAKNWEISVVREDFAHGQISYGWFEDRKRLISEGGGHNQYAMPGIVWDENIRIANEVCERLNRGEVIE